MASISWKGGSGDWNNAANWSGGVVPGASDTVTIAGAGAYTVTLYTTEAVDNLTLNAPGALLYDAGALTLGGTLSLQGGKRRHAERRRRAGRAGGEPDRCDAVRAGRSRHGRRRRGRGWHPGSNRHL